METKGNPEVSEFKKFFGFIPRIEQLHRDPDAKAKLLPEREERAAMLEAVQASQVLSADHPAFQMVMSITNEDEFVSALTTLYLGGRSRNGNVHSFSAVDEETAKEIVRKSAEFYRNSPASKEVEQDPFSPPRVYPDPMAAIIPVVGSTDPLILTDVSKVRTTPVGGPYRYQNGPVARYGLLTIIDDDAATAGVEAAKAEIPEDVRQVLAELDKIPLDKTVRAEDLVPNAGGRLETVMGIPRPTKFRPVPRTKIVKPPKKD